MKKSLLMNVVLFQPNIPWNAGLFINIIELIVGSVGRTCLGFGARLHLVGPLGFTLDNKQTKRAGLDYWPKVDLVVHKNWNIFKESLPSFGKAYFFTPSGSKSMLSCDFEFQEQAVDNLNSQELKYSIALVFGSERYGFEEIENEIPSEYRLHIPMNQESVRSFNLANTTSMAMWEVFKQFHSKYIPIPPINNKS